MEMKFNIEYKYDTETEVYRTVSDINGLNLEDSCLDVLKKESRKTAEKLIYDNHLSSEEKSNYDKGNINISIIENDHDKIVTINIPERM